MKKVINILTLLLIPIAVFGTLYIFNNKKPSTVRAFGVLEVDLGVPSGDPVFVVHNMLPGDCITKNISVTNSGSSQALVAIHSSQEEDNELLSEVLNLKITENSNTLFAKTLKEFFQDSDNPNGVILSTVGVNQSTNYEIEVCFQESADNKYQGDTVSFDLEFGQILPDIVLPEQCAHLTGIISKKITGTTGKDRIRGTIEPELIEGLGGNDDIDSGGGDDCIVGSEGNDKLEGGKGNDTIIGGMGNDKIDGGSGNDIIFGESGEDKIDGGTGEDNINGGDGTDTIQGGSGNDIIYGQDGEDKIEGGAGNDRIEGGNGNDRLYGNSGADNLDGQSDNDYLKGDTGTDVCVNGETIHPSCES